MSGDLPPAERFWLGVGGIVLACTMLAIVSNAAPLLRAGAAVVDWVRGLL